MGLFDFFKKGRNLQKRILFQVRNSWNLHQIVSIRFLTMKCFSLAATYGVGIKAVLRNTLTDILVQFGDKVLDFKDSPMLFQQCKVVLKPLSLMLMNLLYLLKSIQNLDSLLPALAVGLRVLKMKK